ncbi:MAG: xanthine phosphoribosyltransferase [Clostridia bacterium]|nr:xanthine phosphoribosyltransferase [Clostridia bacterium]
MRALEEKIVKEGLVLDGNVLKVGSFLNQMVDTSLAQEMAQEVVRLYKGVPVNKVVTIEASGIAIGFAVAAAMGVPLVFVKKSHASNVSGNVLTARIHSYTHSTDYTATVSADYITKDDCVLIVDDFLANGEALRGLIEIIRSAGATLAGCAVQIEKGFQGGGDQLRSEGVRVESLAIIEKMSVEEGITFRR